MGFKEKPLEKDAKEAVQRLFYPTGPGEQTHCAAQVPPLRLPSPQQRVLIGYTENFPTEPRSDADFSTPIPRPPPRYVILEASFWPLSTHSACPSAPRFEVCMGGEGSRMGERQKVGIRREVRAG